MQRRDHDSFESKQTEHLTALEVSCLNSVYLRLGGGGGGGCGGGAGVCWEEGLLAGGCDGVDDRAGCHNSLGRVPLKWRRGLIHPPCAVSVSAQGPFWFVVYDVHFIAAYLTYTACTPAQNGCRVDWSERMADAAVRPLGKKTITVQTENKRVTARTCHSINKTELKSDTEIPHYRAAQLRMENKLEMKTNMVIDMPRGVLRTESDSIIRKHICSDKLRRKWTLNRIKLNLYGDEWAQSLIFHRHTADSNLHPRALVAALLHRAQNQNTAVSLRDAFCLHTWFITSWMKLIQQAFWLRLSQCSLRSTSFVLVHITWVGCITAELVGFRILNGGNISTICWISASVCFSHFWIIKSCWVYRVLQLYFLMLTRGLYSKTQLSC